MRPVLLSAPLLLAACASTSPPVEAAPPAAPEALDGRTGAPVAFDALVARARTVRAVYVGEHHDRQVDHDLQARLYAALLEDGGDWAFGLEMVQRPFQAPLDAYVAGELDEAGMLAGVEWADRWGFDFGLFRRPFEAARAAGRRLVALNAPQEVTRAVGRGGLEALDEATRAALPELDLDVAAHRAMFDAAMGDHPGLDPSMVDRFYVAQTLWDETMAETVAAYLAEAPERRIVVVAGLFHVLKGLGIPSRAARRGVESHLVVVPVSDEELPEALADGERGEPWGDVLVPTGPAPRGD